MNTRTTLKAIVASLTVGLIAISLVPDYELRHDLARAYEAGYAENPVFDRFAKLGSELSIDVTPMRMVRSEGQINLKDHPIFCEPPHSFDYLIFGDSVANWGISPEVVSQISGKRVATFSSQSIFPNAVTYNFFRQIQTEYLKPSGASLFIFAQWALGKASDELSPIFKDHSKYSKDGFVAAMKNMNSCAADPKLVSAHSNSLFSEGHYQDFRRVVQSIVESLRQEAHLRLPKVDLYSTKIEPKLNPEWAKKKSAGDGRNTLRWNRWSIMLNINSDIAMSKQNREAAKTVDPGFEKAAQAMIAFPGRKFYIVPFRPSGEYPDQRSFHHQFLENQIPLIDLAWDHPANKSYPMETIHMANEGILAMSYQLGLWLKTNDKILTPQE